jgi:hypothetical protein
MTRPYDDYRHHAELCMRMADGARSESMKAEWLALAGKWLALIPVLHNAEGTFEDMLREKGTGQKQSSSSH